MNQFLSKREKKEALDLLVQCIETVTVNPDGNEEGLALWLRDRIEQDGVSARVQPVAPGRANVIARLAGRSDGPALLLNGHLDTVPFGNRANWRTDPGTAVEKDGWLYGRGTSDMKSGLCAALSALLRLAREGFTPERDILFAGTADEETGGLGAMTLMNDESIGEISGILIGEPTGGALSVAAKGTLWLEFDIAGKSSHAAYPDEGINAVEVALAIYREVQSLVQENAKTHARLSPPTCTLTQLHGGEKVNMVPDRCVMTLDIRTLPGTAHDALIEQVRQMLAGRELQCGFRTDMRVTNDRMAVSTDEGDPLITSFSEVVREMTGQAPAMTASNFFSDASIFRRKWNVPVLLYGPGLAEQAHKPNERVELEKYFEAIEGYYRFLKTV